MEHNEPVTFVKPDTDTVNASRAVGSDSILADTSLETTNCPVCNSDKEMPFLHAPDRFRPQAGPVFRIVQCRDCGFIYVNPRPDSASIGQFYQDAGYQPFLSTKSSRSLWDRLYDFVRRFTVPAKRRKLQKFRTSGALLDIGCGTGEFLHEMSRHGWQVAGIEKDENAVKFARTHYGLRQVRNQELEDCQFEAKSFDIITMWHVLEHVHRPKELLMQAAALLNPDGIMAVAMPNIASRDARFYGENWVPLEAPRHLSHFTPAAVAQLCERLQLRLIEYQQMPVDAYYNCLMSEKLLLALRQPNVVIAGLRLVRGLFLASWSALSASRLFAHGKHRGSSVLYIIKKTGK